MYYAGLDLHSTRTQVCVINQQDHRLVNRKYDNDLDVLLKDLEPFKKELRGVVVESTFNWYWLVDGLINNGYKEKKRGQATI